VEGNPILHSNDGDILFLPFGASIDLFQYTLMSRFMFLNLVAAILVATAFMAYVGVQRRYGYAKGGFFNALEGLLVYVRNDIAIPSIGKKDADRFLPLLWTLFFFILVGNLLGMLPYSFTVTSHIIVTFALALFIFVACTVLAIIKHGPFKFLHSFLPEGTPWWMAPLMYFIELFSYLARPVSLSVRLAANMMAGHTMLKVIAGFVAMLGVLGGWLPFALLLVLTGFEIGIAVLQAYIFTVLTCVYLNNALHLH